MGGRKVDRFVKSIDPQHPQFFHAVNVLHDSLRAQRKRQKGSIRADNQIVLQPALEAETRNTEGAILIIHIDIKAIVSGLRNAPGYTLFQPIIDLAFDCSQTALMQQSVWISMHK